MAETTRSSSVSRRSFLRSSTIATGGIALATPFHNFFLRTAEAATTVAPVPGVLGPLVPVLDETTGLPLLRLPAGFSYQSFGWTGDVMDDGTFTPDRHDGMAIVETRGRGGNELVLIRNHERGASDPTNPLPVIGGGKVPVYDGVQIPGVLAGLGGGTTALVYRDGHFVWSSATLGGTLTNCAGGATTWGTWLTCEEVTIRGRAIGAKDHGYVFEVPSPFLAMPSARPIVDMGLMDHEAVALDPVTGIVYLTEDNGPLSGLYRFRPHDSSGRLGSLEAGGALEMLAIAGQDNADLRKVSQLDTFEVRWVPIANPDADPERLEAPAPGFPPIGGAGRSGPYMQGEALGAAAFARLEGAWYHEGVIYFTDTSAGTVGKGVVWALRPSRNQSDADRLTAILVSPDESVADNPDNVTVAPWGGIVLCEDGGGRRGPGGEIVNGTRLIGLAPDGTPFVLAENNAIIEAPIPGKPFVPPNDYRPSEFAGAAFSPRGDVLFVNIQTPGITFAIRGPWRAAGF